MWYIHAMEYYLTVKNNELNTFGATWMDLETVILSEVSQTEGKYCMTCGIWKEMIQMNSLEKWKQIRKEIHRLREGIYGCWGEAMVREFGMDMYTLLYLKWITNRTAVLQGTLLNVMRQPGWERSVVENGYMYMYDRVTLLCT